jgi:hypothetical protein
MNFYFSTSLSGGLGILVAIASDVCFRGYSVVPQGLLLSFSESLGSLF